MKNLLKKFVVVGVMFLSFAAGAEAREADFVPSFGDALVDVSGVEWANVTRSGELVVQSAEGNVLPGFPVEVSGKVFASSPVFVDYDGDGVKEIAVLGRSLGGDSGYVLYVYEGDGSLMGSFDLSGMSFFYDPVVVDFLNQEALVVSPNEGGFVQITYDGQSFSSFQLAPAGTDVVAVSYNPATKFLYVVSPQNSNLDTYSSNGKQTYSLAEAMAYPLALDGGDLYGVSLSGKLVGLDGATYQSLSGFPIDLGDFPLNSPVVSDVDNDGGKELVVVFADGKRRAFNLDGTESFVDLPQKSILDLHLDRLGGGKIYSFVSGKGLQVFDSTYQAMASGLSYLKLVASSGAEIEVEVNSAAIVSGASYDFGSLPLGFDKAVTFTVENTGVENLLLIGDPIVNISGVDSANFVVTQEPNLNDIEPGASTEFTVTFTPDSQGTKAAELILTTNDSDESTFTINLNGEGSDEQFVLLDSVEMFGENINAMFEVSWVDLDGDGLIEPQFSYYSGAVGLYKNIGGVFELLSDGSDLAGLSGVASRMKWADYDNDGDFDFFINEMTVGENDNNRLYSNDGNGGFSYESDNVISQSNSFNMHGAWADYDNDEDLDLYVANTGGIFGGNNGTSFFFDNNGDGTFTENLSGSWVSDLGGFYGASWSDYNNDGLPDLFVSRFVDGNNNILYKNLGGGAFEKVTNDPIVQKSGVNWAAWGDYDSDGDFDVFLASNITDRPSDLYENNGDGTFSEVPTSDIPEIPRSSSGRWGDYDNDGDIDLFVSLFGDSSILYTNNGDGTFVVSNDWAPDGGTSTRDVEWADYDNDGYLDLFLASQLENIRFFKNVGGSNNWLNVRLKKNSGNRFGLGAKVKVRANINGQDVWQYREVFGEDGGSLGVHFGLGDATNVDQLVVEWPGGEVQTLEDIAVDQYFVVDYAPDVEVADLEVTPAASVSGGPAPLNISFSADVVGGLAVEPPPIDLTEYSLDSYGGSPGDKDGSLGTGVIESINGDDVVSLTKNSWKKIDFNYQLTENTILAFDYKSTAEGEIQGIGMTHLHDQMVNSAQSFKLYGTEDWGIGNYEDYGVAGAGHTPGQWKRYTIPIGTFFTDNVQYLFFMNDHDRRLPETSNGMFKNIVVYEQSDANAYTYEWDFGDGSPISNEANPNHQYTNAGEYTVTVAVSDAVQTVEESFVVTVEEGVANKVVYEDAEDGETTGWVISDVTPAGASIANVFEDNIYGNVIEVVGTGFKNAFTLTYADGAQWNNEEQKNISWDMNFTGTYYLYVMVETNHGPGLVIYSSRDVASYGEYMFIDAPNYADGTWQRVTRDLQEDVENERPGTTILKVNGMIIRGSGKIDNIEMF